MTRIEIINAVLSRCGSSTVADENDTADSRIVKANYPGAKDYVLEDGTWTFASDLVQLPLDVGTPAFRWSKQYRIPSGVLKVLRVYTDPVGDTPAQADDWQRKGPFVMSNLTSSAGPLYAEVIVRCDEGLMSPGAVESLIEFLKSVSAVGLTENKDLEDRAWKNYKEKVVDARAMDGSQGRTESLTPPALPGRRQHILR